MSWLLFGLTLAGMVILSTLTATLSCLACGEKCRTKKEAVVKHDDGIYQF
jgi:hypothetical protein